MAQKPGTVRSLGPQRPQNISPESPRVRVPVGLCGNKIRRIFGYYC